MRLPAFHININDNNKRYVCSCFIYDDLKIVENKQTSSNGICAINKESEKKIFSIFLIKFKHAKCSSLTRVDDLSTHLNQAKYLDRHYYSSCNINLVLFSKFYELHVISTAVPPRTCKFVYVI